jgi:hypothetical protein
MKWLADNWDKVATLVISVLISGIIGFFTAVFSVKEDIDNVRDRLAKLEGEEATSVIPKLSQVDTYNKDITSVQGKLDDIQKQTDISINTNKLLDLRIEEERHVTAQILKQFLDDYLKATKATH